jgi:hypothetical protein
MVATGQPGTGASISCRILLDSPTASPALGFTQIGQALATIIKQSEPLRSRDLRRMGLGQDDADACD